MRLTQGRLGTNRKISIFVILVLLCLVIFYSYFKNTVFKEYEKTISGRHIRLVIGTGSDHFLLAEKAFAEYERVLKKFSFFEILSETTKLNEAVGVPKEIDTETQDFLSRLLELSEKTLANYDPLRGSLYITYFNPGSTKNPPLEKGELILEGNTACLEEGSVIFPGRALRGYAMDRVFSLLKESDKNIKGYIKVEEDILVFSPKAAGASWITSLLNAEEGDLPEEKRPIYLSSGAFFQHTATKKLPFSEVQIEEELFLPPFTGDPPGPCMESPPDPVLSAVYADTALEASVFLTAAQNMNPDYFIDRCALWNCVAYLKMQNGEIFKNPEWELLFVNR